MNELKLIKVNELEIGDEIIISSYSKLKYLKVLKLPKLKTNNWGDYYTNVKCSLSKKRMKNGNFEWNVFIFEQDVTKHNSIVYQNLNNRHILLVKKELIKSL